MDQNIQIAVRIKPCSTGFMSPLCYWDSQSIQIADKNAFSFDFVLPPNASQQDVFDKIGFKIIANVLQGYNGCIFAYGQTGSGKTYTMTGYDQEDGIIQRCLRTLWNCVQNSSFFQIKMSYFEIYNETIKDLLSQKENLIIRQKAKSGFYIQNLAEKVVEQYEDFEKLISHGISLRTIKQTKLNQTSSRSHSVLQINVDFKNNQKNGGLNVLRHSKITFIDLAGSEKQKETQVQGQRLKQSVNINKSLSTLSLVISKLSQNSQKKTQNASCQPIIHVPYRNSVLTKILKNSLIGKSKIIIVCTVSLEDRFLDETISTLRFAQTAKSIKMKVKRNEEEYDGTKDRLFEEFQDVKMKYNELRDIYEETQKSNEELRRQNAVLKDQLEKKEVQLNELELNYECMKMQSQQVIRQIKSQSMGEQLSQQQIYNISQANRQPASQTSNFNWSRNDRVQSFTKPEFRQQSFNVPFQSFSNVDSNNQIPTPATQLSFFTTNLSSQFVTPKKSFFTIQEANQKSQNGDSSQVSKIQQKNKTLEKQIKKLNAQKEFFLFDINLKEEQINALTKRMVFLEIKQQQIEQGHYLFSELINNKQFTHAQLKFLKLCLEKSQKDRMAFELMQKEKLDQKTRFNQTIQKVKKLLLKSIQSSSFSQMESIDRDSFRVHEGLFLQSTQQKRSKTCQNVDKMSSQMIRNEFKEKLNADSKLQSPSKVSVPYAKSCNKMMNFERVDTETLQPNSTSLNFKKPSQIHLVSQMSQSMEMMGNFSQQSSQISKLMGDNRSQMSQNSLRFTNQELEYLKKDYQKLCLQVKRLREEIEKNKIMLLQKDSLMEQYQLKLDQMTDKNQKLSEALQTQRYLILMEQKRNSEEDIRSLQQRLTDKESEIHHFKQYLEDTSRNYQQQRHTLKLQCKSLQIAVQRHLQTIDQLKKSISKDQQKQMLSKQNQHLYQEIDRLKKVKEEIDIEQGFLNSENELLTTKYNQLKMMLKDAKDKQTPKKVYLKRSTFYSISQSQEHLDNKNQFIISKPGELTQQQCIQVIETKRLNDMYQAAYFFYKKASGLEEVKRLLQNKVKEMRIQLQRYNEKIKDMKVDIENLQGKLKDEEKNHINFKVMYVEKRSVEVQLTQKLYKKQQMIDTLEQKCKQMIKYVQIVEAKLMEKQHKEFENRQKVNNLTVQMRQNSHQTPPNNIDRNRSFLAKKRKTQQSPDSLSSQATVVRTSTYLLNSRKSMELPRNDFQDDSEQNLIQQIKQVSNEQSKIDKAQSNQKFFKTPASHITHTVTNPNLVGIKRHSKKLFEKNSDNSRNQEFEDFDEHFFEQIINKSKASSIKSDSHGSSTNLRKSEHRNFLSKK